MGQMMIKDKIDAREKNFPHKELPIMDLGPIMAGDKSGIKELAKEWKNIAETLGFMCLINHGVTQDKIEKMEEQIIRFHDQPVDFKMNIRVNDHQRGYIPTLKISDKTRARDILAAKGITLLDCPVSGTGHQAAAGDLVIFGSGDEESFNKIKPAFEKMGREVHYLGEFGTGSKMKYIANLLVVIHNVSSAEAITYGIKAGIDPQLVYDVIKSSAGTSRMFEVRGPMMVEGKYDDNVSANHIITKKDISVILDYADQMACPTPLFSVAGEIHRAAIAMGMAHEDTASVCAVTDKLAGVKRK
jgi:hypothetical protein